MFDNMRSAYDQMQPGDKMVMQFHKSPKPQGTQYQLPGAPGGDMPGGPGPDLPAGPMLPRDGGVPGMGTPYVPGATGAGPGLGPMLSSAGAPSDPLMERQALIAAMSGMPGRQV